MRITRYTDYSLRVLMYVGLKGGQLATIREIAEHYDISRNHLMKVVHELHLKGYLDTTRGKRGGIRLSRPPAEINVGALVRDTEQDLALVECFEPGNECVITPACQLQGVLGEALQAFFRVLDSYTLADLLPAEDRPAIVRLLRMDPVFGVPPDTDR